MKLSRRQWFRKNGLLIPAAIGLARPSLAQTLIINSFRFAAAGGGGTFGKESIGGFNAGTSRIFYFPFTAPENGTIQTLHWYGSAASDTALGVAVYSDSSGAPNALLAQDSGNATATSTPGWHTLNLSLAISSGTVYHFAFWGAGSVTYYYDAVAGGRTSALLTFENWPDPASLDSTTVRQPSIYATYT